MESSKSAVMSFLQIQYQHRGNITDDTLRKHTSQELHSTDRACVIPLYVYYYRNMRNKNVLITTYLHQTALNTESNPSAANERVRAASRLGGRSLVDWVLTKTRRAALIIIRALWLVNFACYVCVASHWNVFMNFPCQTHQEALECVFYIITNA